MLWFHRFFFGVCGVLCCFRSYFLWSQQSIQDHITYMVFVSTTPRQGGLRFGTARKLGTEQAVPRGRSRRFFKAVNGWGGDGSKYSRRPAVAKQAKPINSDPLQVQVESVVSTPWGKQKKKCFWGHVARFRCFLFIGLSWTERRSRCAFFSRF